MQPTPKPKAKSGPVSTASGYRSGSALDNSISPSQHASEYGHPASGYNHTPESPSVWESLKKVVGWKTYDNSKDTVGGAAGKAKQTKAGNYTTK